MSSYEQIYETVCQIPSGRVASYGQIAELAGLPRRARQVGYALAALPESRDDVPWHRVINAQGQVSPRHQPGYEDLQRMMLEAEGVFFDVSGRVSFRRFGWDS